jgi:hypothetical protein
MSPRVVTFGAQTRTAPRRQLCGAASASRSERTERTERTNATEWSADNVATTAELSSWSGDRRRENPRTSCAARATLSTRDLSPRQLLTDHENVARPTDTRLITVDAPSGPAAELSTNPMQGEGCDLIAT